MRDTCLSAVRNALADPAFFAQRAEAIQLASTECAASVFSGSPDAAPILQR